MAGISAGKLWGMRRLADANGRFKMTAVDQRPPIINPIREKRGTATAPWEDVATFKAMLVEELQDMSSALLLDPNFAYPKAATLLDPRKGLIVTLEDSQFEETPQGRFSAEIADWSVAKIRRMGADAVKVLVWYRPDAATSVLTHQKDFAKRIGEICATHDIPYVFELLVYPLQGEAGQTGDYIEMPGKRADHILESVREFGNPAYGIDLFKLESPVAAKDCDGSAAVQRLFDQLGAVAEKPWVMLSAGAGMKEFHRVLEHAYAAGASGYLAGRAIWLEAFGHFPDWDAIRSALKGDARAYMRDLNALTDAAARPWWEHAESGEAQLQHAGPAFASSYGSGQAPA
jgi:tagatose 1,6-diphosphate aldolase